MSNACPRCSSERVKRSRNRNLFERLLKIVNIRPYRCIHCGWRGFRYGKASQSVTMTKYSLPQIIMILLIMALAIIATLYYMTREEPREAISGALSLTLALLP